jgi:hypothetical protein
MPGSTALIKLTGPNSGLDRSYELVGLGDVERQGERGVLVLLDDIRDIFDAPGGHDDPIAGLQGLLRNGPAQPLRAPGHQPHGIFRDHVTSPRSFEKTCGDEIIMR